MDLFQVEMHSRVTYRLSGARHSSSHVALVEHLACWGLACHRFVGGSDLLGVLGLLIVVKRRRRRGRGRRSLWLLCGFLAVPADNEWRVDRHLDGDVLRLLVIGGVVGIGGG